jgi:hypothetical protein
MMELGFTHYLIVGAGLVLWLLAKGGDGRVSEGDPRPRRTPSGNGWSGRSFGRPLHQGDFWRHIDATRVRATARISYRKESGEISDRTVDIDRFGHLAGNAYLHGLCHLRRDGRTFRVDRIIRLVDVETGEVIEDTLAWLTAKAS